MKIVLRKILVCLLLVGIYSNCSAAQAKSLDYVSIFGKLVDCENNNAALCDFLMENYMVASIDHFCDCYIVDMDNNSVPELLCLFIDDDHEGMKGYAALIEYNNGFQMGSEIPFEFSDGSGNSLWYQILESNGKFYFAKFVSSRYTDGAVAEEEINQQIVLTQDEIDTVVYSAQLKGYTDFQRNEENYVTYVNGQIVEEFDYEYVRNNFNIVADSADYNYNPYSFENIQYNFGKNFAKYWKQKNDSITVTIDNKEILFDQQPIMLNNRTLVPLRAIFEELGATVDWDDPTQTVTSTKGPTTVSMSIGKAEMYKNGKLITLDVVPQLVGNRTLVPVRAVAESFDCKVDWDEDTQTVIIKTMVAE